jgi:HSP20 family molecular chaperone IbpA
MSLFQSIIPSLSRSPTDLASSSDGDSSRAIKPAYEIKENAEAYDLTVYLPGATKDAVEITNDDGQLRVHAQRNWQQPAGWTSLYRESAEADYELVLAHDNAIDPGKIAAELRDGVLRLTLPKHEAVKPRKIAVA